MFSFLKKEKKSPNDSNSGQTVPPIQGPADDFIMVNRRNDLPYPVGPPGTNPSPMYPSFNMNIPHSSDSTVSTTKKDVNFLQGVPFSLNKEFTSGSRNDILAAQLSEIMAYCTRRLNVQSTDYEFQVERSVLNES